MPGTIPECPVVAHDAGSFAMIEDDLGFRVVLSITYSPLGPMALDWVGRTIGDKTINSETQSEGLAYDDAMILCLSGEKAVRQQETSKRVKGKRK